MRRLVALIALMGLHASAQNVSVSKALFRQSDDMNWTKAYGWYRIHEKGLQPSRLFLPPFVTI